MIDLVWLLVQLALATTGAILVGFCALTSTHLGELARSLFIRWRNRHFYDGVDLRTLRPVR